MNRYASLLALAFLVAACGDPGPTPTPAAEGDPSGLTQDQLENGIGPIRTVELGEIDPALAARGEELFLIKCSACHKMAERYVGPALGDVVNQRTAPYIMNMILNPEEMIQSHPEARKMFAQFMTPMANQNLTEDEARSVLEFLRTQVPE